MRYALAVLLVATQLSAAEISLFDGETLFGWEPATKANWAVKEGVISVSEGEPGLLVTTSEFADYVLRVEFRAAADTNSGIFLRTPPKPTDPAADCYELNIATEQVSPFPTGSFVKRQKGTVPTYSSEWQTYEVRAEAGRFVVALDGKPLLDYTDPKPILRGRIGLQFNQGKVEFRRVTLEPLGLKPLFNGRDLTGWHAVPGGQSVFGVGPEGWIDVKNGRGSLESDVRLANFLLQADVFVNGDGLNSGIFFRCIPGEPTNGYESQIHNGYKNGDRSQPADCGTGGIFRRQPARRVVADDRTWFTKTILADGPHVAVWVNGQQVTDWTDSRPEDPNPRKGLRLEAGTLQLQGHDPTTDLRFRNLSAVELPPRG